MINSVIKPTENQLKMSMLRLETEFILSDINFSKWDEKSLFGVYKF
jgi:hypothetical protein